MPISHTCPCCCLELGHIRAAPDPHYGLGVVVCPRCRAASVRVRHPDRVFWQGVRRLRRSIVKMLEALLLTAVSVAGMIGLAFWIHDEITTPSPRYTAPDLADAPVPFMLGLALLFSALAGAIARVAYPHRRFLTVLGLFALLIAVFFSIDAVATAPMVFVGHLVGSDASFRLPDRDDLLRRALAMLPLMPPFIIGMGLGGGVNAMARRASGRRIVRIRRRLRRRRARTD